MVYHGQILSCVNSCFQAGLRGEGEDTTPTLGFFADAAFTSLLQVAEVCEQAASIGVLRCSPVMCRNLPSSYALWTCGAVGQHLQGDSQSPLAVAPAGSPQTHHALLAACERICKAIATVDSAKGTSAFVEALRGAIERVTQAKGTDAGIEEASVTALPEDLLSLFLQQQAQSEEAEADAATILDRFLS